MPGAHRTPHRRSPATVRPHGARPEIQGLRAIAVTMVVLFHLHPSLPTGGFAGVDVFFVISGFLITGHLARTLRRTGRVGLGEFYARRVRRLLPAAVVVLVVTWFGSRWLLPSTQLPAAAEQIRASALYVQNWVLARDAVDYFANTAPSPVQHFWSLSLEEQFYVFWPLLFVLAALLRGTARRALPLVLGAAVFAVSLALAWTTSANDAPAAYFQTTTRVWELAAGGLLALLPARLTDRAARWGWLGWLGLAAIAVSAFRISGTASFLHGPALLPVAGAFAVLLAGSAQARFGPARLLSWRPAVFIGDISYSVYLWHWPLIIFYIAYRGHRPGPAGDVAIVAATLVLSWLTTRFVEDPIRAGRFARLRPRFAIAVALAAVVPVTLTSVWLAEAPGRRAGRVDAQHPGAAVLAGPAAAGPLSGGPLSSGKVAPSANGATSTAPAVPISGTLNRADLVPDLASAAHDWAAYGKGPGGCQTDRLVTDLTPCVFGDTTHPTRTVMLVGDSVAGEWFDNLNDLAKREHWRLITQLHSLCPWTSATARYQDGTPYTACHDWGRNLLADILQRKPDLVLTSARPTLGTMDHPSPGKAAFAELGLGMVPYWQQLHAAGIAVAAIRESPEMSQNVPDCLASRNGSMQRCSDPARKAVLQNTPLVVATRATPGISTLIDMNRYICAPTVCPPVVGNIVVYIDSHHITRTYAWSLRPYFDAAIKALPVWQK